MKVVYLCRTGGHAAPVAAAVRLGLLPAEERPTPEALMRVPYFGRIGRFDSGFLLPCGRTAQGDEIYVAGRGRYGRLVSEITAAAAGLCRDEFRVIGCERAVGEWRLLAMHLAGILLGPQAGRALAARLLRRCYPALAGLALADRDRGRG